VNSEELELSLRTEFENYLKDALAGVRQEMSGLQEKIEAELEKHKSQLNTVFEEFANRFDSDKALDPAFIESVVEHMRLARDEGARITATAIAEAESMEKETESAPAAADFGQIRDAIADISTKTSQSSILKALIHHAAEFTPRGAFFIIKNEHFVGWRVFGKEGHSDDQAVREVFFPVAADTVLGQSVRSLGIAEGAYGTNADDPDYLNRLGFGQPDKMYAIPLVARGRGVAVLYADYGQEGVAVNVEALEALVSIAGLTVELLAASQGAKAQQAAWTAAAETSQDLDHEELAGDTAFPETYTPVEDSSHDAGGFAFTQAPVEETEFEYSDTPASEELFAEEPVEEPIEEPVEEPAAEFEPESGPVAAEEPYAWSEPMPAYEPAEEAPAFESTDEVAYETPVAEEEAPVPEFSSGAAEYEFESTSGSYEDTAPEPAAWDAGTVETEEFAVSEPAPGEPVPAFEGSNGTPEAYVPQPAPDPIVETVSAQPVKTRFSDRNVDLPIEVAEES
jgi:hypothetical protein